MSKIITPNDPHFNPDLVVTIKMDTKTGQIHVETGNSMPINPLILAGLCVSVANANITAVLTGSQLGERKGNKPHAFFALPGEHRCRVPGCQKIKDDLIHLGTEADTPKESVS